MPEMCENRPGQECRSATRLALLENRVDALERGQEKEEKFRKDFYADREERIEHDTRLDEKIRGMDVKLDKLVARQDDMDSKPARRWDSLVDKALWVVILAVVAWLSAGMPGVGT